MKNTIKKYYWLFFIGIIPVIITAPLKGNFELVNYFKAVLFLLIFPLVAAIILSIIDVKIVGRYYLNLNEKIAKLFDAEIKSPNLCKTYIGRYSIYILIDKDENLPVKFHIPRNQIDKMRHKPKFKYRKSTLNKLKTYLIYSSTGFLIKRNKMKIETLINDN